MEVVELTTLKEVINTTVEIEQDCAGMEDRQVPGGRQFRAFHNCSLSDVNFVTG